MPRRAAAARQMQEVALPIVRPKPIPPNDLTPEQAQDWLRLTNRLPDDLLADDVAPLLTELARHISYARQLNEELVKLRHASLRPARVRSQLGELLRLHERQSMRVAILMQKLRLSPQARETSWEFDRRRLKAPAPAHKPWQLEALDLAPIEVLPGTPSEREN